MNKLRENEPISNEIIKVTFQFEMDLIKDIKNIRKNENISQKKLVNTLLKNSLKIYNLEK